MNLGQVYSFEDIRRRAEEAAQRFRELPAEARETTEAVMRTISQFVPEAAGELRWLLMAPPESMFPKVWPDVPTPRHSPWWQPSAEMGGRSQKIRMGNRMKNLGQQPEFYERILTSPPWPGIPDSEPEPDASAVEPPPSIGGLVAVGLGTGVVLAGLYLLDMI